MNQKEKLEMVNRAIEGDKSAFAILAEEIAEDVTHICIHILGNRQDGEDAAQDAMLRIKQSLGKLKNPKSFTSWRNRIIERSCKMIIINRGYTLNEEDMDKFPAASAGNGVGRSSMAEKYELRLVVREEIKKLPENYREAVYLFYFEDLPLKTIAAMLDTNIQQVITTLYRARKALRLGIEDQLGREYVPGVLIPFTIKGCILLSGISNSSRLVQALFKTASRMIAGAGTVCKIIAGVFSQVLQRLPHVTQGLEAVLVAGLALGLCRIEYHTVSPNTYLATPYNEAAVITRGENDALDTFIPPAELSSNPKVDTTKASEESQAGPSTEINTEPLEKSDAMATDVPRIIIETVATEGEADDLHPKQEFAEEPEDVEVLPSPGSTSPEGPEEPGEAKEPEEFEEETVYMQKYGSYIFEENGLNEILNQVDIIYYSGLENENEPVDEAEKGDRPDRIIIWFEERSEETEKEAIADTTTLVKNDSWAVVVFPSELLPMGNIMAEMEE